MQKVLDNSPDFICSLDREGRFIYCSEACKSLLGYSRQEMENRCYQEFLHPEDEAITRELVGSLLQGVSTRHFENRYLHKSGPVVVLFWSAYWSEEEQMLFAVAREAQEQKQQYRQLQQQQQWYQAMLRNGMDMMALVSAEGHLLFTQGSPVKNLGYPPGQLLGRRALSLVHPGDQAQVSTFLESLLTHTETLTLPEVRLQAADGSWRWFELTGTNHLTHPDIQALVVNAREITENLAIKEKLRESELRFRSLFDHHPDLVVMEDPRGLILDLNPVALDFFNLPKTRILNRPITDFLPVKSLPVGRGVREAALQGQPVRFRMDLELDARGRRVFDLTKIPVVVQDEIVGVFCLARDITAVTQAQELIQQQAHKLNTIFESITDAFCTLDKDWTITYINGELERLLHLNREKYLGCNVWQEVPEEVNQVFYQQFHQAARTGQAVRFEAWLQRLDKCLEVKAFPSEEGLSVYFTDITEKIKTRQELEKLSLVASRTDIGVIISDAGRRIEWVNEGFTQNTGFSWQEAQGKRLSELLRSERKDTQAFQQVKRKIVLGQPGSYEILNLKKTGEPVWHAVQVNPICNSQGQITRFVTTQTDITALKQSQLQLAALSQDLDRQNQDLHQFSYIVSHNLRAPVANALGLAELLCQADKRSGLFDQALDNLKTSVGQLDLVLRDLNQILKVRNKGEMPEKELVDLVGPCRQAVDHHRQALYNLQAQVRLHLPQEIQVLGNKAYLYAIFHQLLSNAIKFRCEDRPLEIDISLQSQTAETCVIAFRDNGRGIDLEKAGSRLFKLYERFHREVEGRGMGLFLVKTQLEALGGRVEISSQHQVGTCFLLHFPCTP
ncbi:MAG: PAS domain S-box protein [Adhaeribacter sp.]